MWLGSYISNRFHARGLLIALMMEVSSISEISVNFYQTAQHYNPEDSHLYTYCCDNLKIYCEQYYCSKNKFSLHGLYEISSNIENNNNNNDNNNDDDDDEEEEEEQQEDETGVWFMGTHCENK
jgi:hypothetical protein